MYVLPRILMGSLLVAASPAQAQPSAADILKEVDQIVGGNVDQTMSWDCLTEQGGKEVSRIAFKVQIKGTLWRRVDFESPANLKGMRVLVRSPQETYIYLPEFRKVRRVASHTKEQGFMGTAWDYGGVFAPESLVDKGLYWSLQLKRRPDQDFRYDRIELDVRKDMKQPIEIRYFDASGVKIKTEKRSDFVCGYGACSPRTVVVTDHTRGNLASHMSLKDWKANQGLSDGIFTLRALERE